MMYHFFWVMVYIYNSNESFIYTHIIYISKNVVSPGEKKFLIKIFSLFYIFFQKSSHIVDQIAFSSTLYVIDRLIGLVGRVFANGPGDLGSIPGRVIPKTLKMVLDTSLFNTQQYKVRIKGKVEQSRERSSALPYTLV